MRRGALVCILALVAAAMMPSVALAVVTQVAGPTVGSSNPTAFATNHRIAITGRGRLLVVYGLHARGVQLAWKDPGAGWNTSTTGDATDGVLLDVTNSGDWPSSIVVAKDGKGAQRAWVVMGRPSWARPGPVRMRVLSHLDSPSGPTVGPLVAVDNAPLGDAFVDLAIEHKPNGGNRGVVIFVKRFDNTTWRLETRWIKRLSTDQPTFSAPHALLTSTTGRRQGTVVPTRSGLSIVARGDTGALTMFLHNRHLRPNRWKRARAIGVHVMAKGKPAATGLAHGSVLAAVESAPGHVMVQRFAPDGKKIKTILRLTGFAMPSIASFRNDAWLVMRRNGDGVIVSRRFSRLGGWTPPHIVLGAGFGGNYAWPNVLRSVSGKKLRFVVRSERTGTRAGVLAVERTVRLG